MNNATLTKEEKALLGLVQVLFPNVKFIHRSFEPNGSINFLDKNAAVIGSLPYCYELESFKGIPYDELFTLVELLPPEL